MVLEGLQTKLESIEDAGPIVECKTQLRELLDKEEIMWRQRSKSLWLKAGDRNTSFFHAVASKRKRNNMISRIKDGQGNWVEKYDEIAVVFTGYFKEIFDTSHPHEMERIFQATEIKVNEEMNEKLLKEFTSNEVKCALVQMNMDNTPGPNGMTVGFYKK